MAWYPEEQAGFVVPAKYLKTKDQSSQGETSGPYQERNQNSTSRHSTGSSETVVEPGNPNGSADIEQGAKEKEKKKKTKGGEKDKSHKSGQKEGQSESSNGNQQQQMPSEDDPNIVTWYGPTDPANPLK